MAFITPTPIVSRRSTQFKTSSVTPLAPRQPSRARVSMVSTSTAYDSLAAITTIVEDTGDISQIRLHRPHSATTNPSLVTAAAQLPQYAHLLDQAVEYGRRSSLGGEAQLHLVRDYLFVLFGKEILEYIPGDVSTEVDARLSFDVDAQVETATRLIRMYDEVGVSKDRVLVKLATTWEGVQACRQLEAMGIKTNMTLLFGKAQAIAAAEAGAYLISPFVGRILDWYKKKEGVTGDWVGVDPGVSSVRDIYKYYKCMGYDTIVMGASFRNVGEIVDLAGCDRLTIAPKYIAQLKEADGDIERKLGEGPLLNCDGVEKIDMNEGVFRWMMNDDAMATEKLAEGIRGFAKDLNKLDFQLKQLMQK
eukprot:GFKZ01005882.1.p2 GENE.GFKZ01005882.1~~GFKZ01005882.1.p2  ORF type:complete len:362 (-),score=78.90 GFKZ01005882.1:1780-2865(-)